ncbi:MAG: hypothetical protein MRJ92_03250 [Nitrospira sp.]|nr:hypothetical protein [Nitrospira sp.]
MTDSRPWLAAWQMRLPGLDSQAGPVGPGEILAIVTATRLSVTGHWLGLYGWVRPAYRLGSGTDCSREPSPN